LYESEMERTHDIAEQDIIAPREGREQALSNIQDGRPITWVFCRYRTLLDHRV